MRALRVAFVLAVLFAFAPDVFADDSLALKWQLPQGAKYTYDYSQEITVEMDGKDATQGAGKSFMKVEGPIIINCNGAGAMVKLDMRPTRMTIAGHVTPAGQMDAVAKSNEMPMDADGRITQGRYPAGANMQLLFDMIFPLPQKPMDVLQSTSQDVVMPNLKGEAVYTLVGVRMVEGMECIAYHVACNLKSEKHTGNNGLETSALAADYDCLFAKERGFFVSVDGTATIKTDFQDKERPVNKSTMQRHKTSLKLKAAEYKAAASKPAPAPEPPLAPVFEDEE